MYTPEKGDIFPPDTIYTPGKKLTFFPQIRSPWRDVESGLQADRTHYHRHAGQGSGNLRELHLSELVRLPVDGSECYMKQNQFNCMFKLLFILN